MVNRKKAIMKSILLVVFIAFIAAGCSRTNVHRVEIFTLKSFQYKFDTTTVPARILVMNPVLADTPLVADAEIISYTRGLYTFTTRKDLSASIRSVNPQGALAVCVDGSPVYYVKVHHAYLSSLAFGIAFFDPLSYHDKKLRIDFVKFTGTMPSDLDKRNDSRLMSALAASGRLK